MKSIKLDNVSYHQYLEGREIQCEGGLVSDEGIEIGEHVMVFKESAAAYTSASTPKREMQSDYIGIEGVITGIEERDNEDKITIRKL